MIESPTFSTLSWRFIAALVFMTLLLSISTVASKDSKSSAALNKTFGNTGKKNLKVGFMEDLNFGAVSSDPSFSGKVVINPATGMKEVYGAYDLGGSYSRGELKISGAPLAKFLLTLPKKVVLRGKGGVAIKLTEFKAHPSTTGVLGPDGQAIVYLGATLTLQANQRGIKSSGNIHIFVDYLP